MNDVQKQRDAYDAHAKSWRDYLARQLDMEYALGATIAFDPAGLMHPTDPPLGTVLADNKGRLWSMKFHDGKHTLTRVL